MSRYLPLWIVMALVILFALGLTLNPKHIPSPLVGQAAPWIQGSALNETTYFDKSSVQGRWWVLNVWASWCVSCRQEHQDLIHFHAQHPELLIYGLNYKDTVDDASTWLKRLGNPYTQVWLDTQGKDGMNWGVYGVPETFLINPEGVVKHRWTGPMDKSSLAKLWQMTLEEQ